MAKYRSVLEALQIYIGEIKTDYNLTRLGLIFLSTLLILGSTSVWNSLGYLTPYAWFLEWSDVGLSFILIYIALSLKKINNLLYLNSLAAVSLVFAILSYFPVFTVNMQGTVSKAVFMIYLVPIPAGLILLFTLTKQKINYRFVSIFLLFSIIFTIGFIAYSFYAVNPKFPTDESLFDLYSAHLFLHGLNPYDPNLMRNSFEFYNFPINFNSPITPLTTGGIVNTMTYPALSFLLFIPAALFGLNMSLMVLPFFAVPIVIVWYKAWKTGDYRTSSLVTLPFILMLLYAYQAGSAYTDVFWASFLMLSYVLLPKMKTSGIFFGLSLSVKQFPAIILPFFDLLYLQGIWEVKVILVDSNVSSDVCSSEWVFLYSWSRGISSRAYWPMRLRH